MLQIVEGDTIVCFKAPFTGAYLIDREVDPRAIYINGQRKGEAQNGNDQETEYEEGA